jgi:predicted TIM-barrel fold metal-dependent hydrolase
MLQTLMVKFPKIKIIIDHLMSVPIALGEPYTDSAPLFSLANNPNIYLKLSIITVRECKKGLATPESFLARVVNAFGSHRIAWGSNFPASDGTLLEMVKETQEALGFLSAQDVDNILSHTAKELYPALK